MPHDEQEAARMSKERGRIAATIKDPDERRTFIERQGRLEGMTTDPTGTSTVGYTPGIRRELERENAAVRSGRGYYLTLRPSFKRNGRR